MTDLRSRPAPSYVKGTANLAPEPKDPDMPTLDDLFNEHEAEREAAPAPAPKPSAHGLTPLIDATFAQRAADRQAIIDTIPRGRFNRLDHDAIRKATAGLDAAYSAFLATPAAKAELAALAAWEAAQPDDEPEADEPEDEEEDSDSGFEDDEEEQQT